MIPKETLEQIRAASDIVTVIGGYIQLKRAGGVWKACCPFHNEKTPSFTVNQQRQAYHCFGCHTGGDVFHFVMQYEGLEFVAAVELLADRAGITLAYTDDAQKDPLGRDALYQIHDQLAEYYYQALKNSAEGDAGRRYLQERQIGLEVWKTFSIGYAPNDGSDVLHWGRQQKYTEEQLEKAGLIKRSEKSGRWYGRFRGRVMFPICNESGRVIGFSGRVLPGDSSPAKYINSPETVVFKKSRVLFGLNKARKSIVHQQRAVLCEGQIDTIRCHMAGVDNVIASQGTALTEEHARLLKRYTDHVVFVLDADIAGQNAAIRSADIFLRFGLTVDIAALPAKEDPDSLIRDRGAEAFNEVLATAAPAVAFQIDVLSSRESRRDPATLMHVCKPVLQTLSQVPSAVYREQLVQVAAARLGVTVSALEYDLVALAKREQQAAGRRTAKGTTAARPAPVQSVPAHQAGGAADTAPAARQPSPERPVPVEEITLMELLCRYPQTMATVQTYLPLEHLDHPASRALMPLMLNGQSETLLSAIDPSDNVLMRLASRLHTTVEKPLDQEVEPEAVMQDVILTIHRKSRERRRVLIKQQLRQSPTATDERQLRMEYRCLTFDINKLQEAVLKKQWDLVEPIIRATF